MAVGEDETIPVRPLRVVGVDYQMALPEDGGQVGHPHRHARMAGVGALYTVHSQGPDSVGGQMVPLQIDNFGR